MRKERDGEGKLQGLVLAGDVDRASGMLQSRGGTWALAGVVLPHGVADTTSRWMEGWMDARAALSPAVARHPPAVQQGEGVFKAGL